MLLYIVDYPEKLHHPSEERLFALLQLRTESVNDEITRLREQHIRGEAMVRALEHKLTQYELDRGAGFPPFAKAAEEYIRFSLDHMRLEEQAVLPAAESCLTEPDWAAADLSFGANQGARGGLADKQSFDNLFSLIVNTAPANRGGAEELKPLLRQ
jgi:hemerythrin-like domain-containing protein